MTQLKTDLDNIFKYEKVILRDSDCFKKILDFENDYICVIDCQFGLSCDEEVENVKLHYTYNYWGSNEFHEILDKYGLMFEWYDTCMGVVFKPDNNKIIFLN